tara:strand:+ start:226 stop:414 length:189 start_codon:yes stop_codon:yes gene_type:complete
MNELYYFPKVKVNAKIAEIINPGYHIEIDGYRYENIIRKPRGRSILRRLRSMDEQTSITIYS